MVYSAAKGNPSLSLTWARAPEVGLPRPDLVVFLDLETEEARRRGGWGEEKYEKEEMQKRVRELFHQLTDEEQSPDDKELELVNAGGSVEEVSEKIWSLVRTRVEGIQGEIRVVQ
jgi:dTMP kinase